MDRPATLANWVPKEPDRIPSVSNSPFEGIQGETPNSLTELVDRSATLANLDQSIRDHKGSSIQVTLKYFKNIPAIRGIQQISRPSNRTYINVKRILKYSIEQN